MVLIPPLPEPTPFLTDVRRYESGLGSAHHVTIRWYLHHNGVLLRDVQTRHILIERGCCVTESVTCAQRHRDTRLIYNKMLHLVMRYAWVGGSAWLYGYSRLFTTGQIK